MSSIASLQDKQVDLDKCENGHCSQTATHIDTRKDRKLCQPHSFTVNRHYRAKIIKVKK